MGTAREFLTSPVRTGAVTAASTALAEAMVRNADLENRRRVVELGPGTGVITAELLPRLDARAQFFAIELNETFARRTRERCPDAVVHQGDALQLERYLADWGGETCDAIVSSLPWTLMKPALQQDLLDTVKRCLAPGGIFVTYIYTTSTLRADGREFMRSLRQRFCTDQCSREHVFRSLPPAWVMRCEQPHQVT